MAEINFNRTKRIGQRDKDIVYGYMKGIQSILPDDNPYFIIVQLIQDLCLLYFHKTIDTKILTDNETDLFIELLIRNNKEQFKNFEWELIYRASRDTLDEHIAKKAYENKKNIICFIQSENNNVFGGYASVKWISATSLGKKSEIFGDENAFVFGIRSSKNYSPIISSIKKDDADRALCSFEYFYLMWGYDV